MKSARLPSGAGSPRAYAFAPVRQRDKTGMTPPRGASCRDEGLTRALPGRAFGPFPSESSEADGRVRRDVPGREAPLETGASPLVVENE